jgi:protein-tyrosine phosphatase
MEVVLRQKFAEASLDIEVDSAGTENYHIGAPPDSRSIQHAQKRGYDLTALRARQVRKSDFHEFDLILAADDLNISALTRVCPPELRHKIALFLENAPLPDPYYGGAAGFEAVLDFVEKRAEEIVEKLLSE